MKSLRPEFRLVVALEIAGRTDCYMLRAMYWPEVVSLRRALANPDAAQIVGDSRSARRAEANEEGYIAHLALASGCTPLFEVWRLPAVEVPAMNERARRRRHVARELAVGVLRAVWAICIYHLFRQLFEPIG